MIVELLAKAWYRFRPAEGWLPVLLLARPDARSLPDDVLREEAGPARMLEVLRWAREPRLSDR